MATLALGATALIVPGTGTPNANIVPNYMQNAVDYYLQGTFCTTRRRLRHPRRRSHRDQLSRIVLAVAVSRLV